MSNSNINELLDVIEDSASEDEIIPEKIEWDESSDAAVDEIVEELSQADAEKEGEKKLSKKELVKQRMEKLKKEKDAEDGNVEKKSRKPRAKKAEGENVEKKSVKTPRQPKQKKEKKEGATTKQKKLFECEAPPGDGIIVQQSITFGTSLSEQQTTEIIGYCPDITFSDDNSSATIVFNDWTVMSTILRAVESIRTICKRDKITIKGNVFCLVRESPNAQIRSGVIKINTRHPVFTECQYKVTVLAEKKENDGKKLTNDEKMQLFREYYEEHHKIPEKKEMYKDFKVGQFYEAAMKNKDMVTQIDEIMEKGQ